MRWQKTARVGVAVIGTACAAAVYWTMGERVKPTVVAAPVRQDPSAMIESSGNVLQQVSGTRQDYLIEAEQQLTYPGGATTLVGVTITVRNRGGRDYVVKGHEARAGEHQTELHLSGGVSLEASDGFIVRTAAATFNQQDGLMTAPGAVTFERDRMTGSGVGMSYDKNHDVLTLSDESHVNFRNEHGNTTMEFQAGMSTFSRMEHRLALEGHVHALREGQVLEAVTGVAHLSEGDDHVTAIELRGDARVMGGGRGLDAMSARDMDLRYSADGQTLEQVSLRGGGSVAMTGSAGAAGRHLLGETLEITLGPDGSLTRATGRERVRLDLPAAAGAGARTIGARAMDAAGAAGKGLTDATFTDAVEYREAGADPAGARVARSRTLGVMLADDAVTAAVFRGGVVFDEPAMRATGGEARYDPAAGSLRLTGAENGVAPRVSDDRVTIDASDIAVALEGRRMRASGGVRTSLRAGSGGGAAGGTKLPSLLAQGQAANVNADALDYQGASGKAVYTGGATLWQGETAIRADLLTIDQGRGDLSAVGNARSSLVLDTGVSVARAGAIEYQDAEHTLRYTGTKAGAGVAPAPAQVSGPQGDLRADRIDVMLDAHGGHIDRLEAYANVTFVLTTKTASGDRLTYFAADERYVMSGGGGVPVKVVESCQETTGKTLTFFKSTDRIIVDGNEEIRTQTKSGVNPTCAQTPHSR